jgi:hypothetical protein
VTRPQLSDPDDRRRAFLVERYLSPAAATDLAAATSRLASLCTAGDMTETNVQYLYSAYLPSEDTCFCLFRAGSSAMVRAANERAQFAFDRLTDAVLMVGLETDVRSDQTHRGTDRFRT